MAGCALLVLSCWVLLLVFSNACCTSLLRLLAAAAVLCEIAAAAARGGRQGSSVFSRLCMRALCKIPMGLCTLLCLPACKMHAVLTLRLSGCLSEGAVAQYIRAGPRHKSGTVQLMAGSPCCWPSYLPCCAALRCVHSQLGMMTTTNVTCAPSACRAVAAAAAAVVSRWASLLSSRLFFRPRSRTAISCSVLRASHPGSKQARGPWGLVRTPAAALKRETCGQPGALSESRAARQSHEAGLGPSDCQPPMRGAPISVTVWQCCA